MNSVQLVGKINGEPDLRYTDNSPKVSFKLKVPRLSGKVDYIPCVAFADSAKMFFGKVNAGDMVEVVGMISCLEKFEVVAKSIKPIVEEEDEYDPLLRGIKRARPICRA